MVEELVDRYERDQWFDLIRLRYRALPADDDYSAEISEWGQTTIADGLTND